MAISRNAVTLDCQKRWNISQRIALRYPLDLQYRREIHRLLHAVEPQFPPVRGRAHMHKSTIGICFHVLTLCGICFEHVLVR